MKYGLKLWSTNNRDLFKQAVQLYKNKKIDFIELYIVPDSLILGESVILNDLKNIPTTIHTSHEEHNLNFKIADFLNSKFIIVHPEEGNIKKINDKRILIENMPKFGTDGEIIFGYSYEQLKPIKDCGFNFCLDLAKAIKSAIGQNIDYKKFIEKLISELNPFYFHISNGRIDNAKDEHRDLFDGDFDIKWLKETLIGVEEKKEVYLVFETPKGEKGLDNDVKNMNYFLFHLNI